METNRRLRAGVRWVDVGRRDLSVHLGARPCQINAAPAPLHEKGGLIDDIVVSPDVRSFMASIYSKNYPLLQSSFWRTPEHGGEG
jgi:hypothetical protein